MSRLLTSLSLKGQKILGSWPGTRHIERLMTTPLVFDRSLVRRRLARALSQGYADFLLVRAVEDLEERLSTVLRTFTLALDVGTPTPIVDAPRA
jgi:hypothetical protein